MEPAVAADATGIVQGPQRGRATPSTSSRGARDRREGRRPASREQSRQLGRRLTDNKRRCSPPRRRLRLPWAPWWQTPVPRDSSIAAGAPSWALSIGWFMKTSSRSTTKAFAMGAAGRSWWCREIPLTSSSIPIMHAIFVDGVFATDPDGKPVFHALPRLSTEEVGDLLQGVRARVLAHLVRRETIEPGSELTLLDDGRARSARGGQGGLSVPKSHGTTALPNVSRPWPNWPPRPCPAWRPPAPSCDVAPNPWHYVATPASK